MPAESSASLTSRAAHAGKSNHGAPGYSRWVNRPLGRRLAMAAFWAGLTPNQVTAASALMTFSGIALLATATPGPGVGLVVGTLLAVAYALDSADGQLARMRGGGTPDGEWLDHVVDCVKVATLHMAVLISWYRHFDLPDAMLLVPIAFGVQASVFFFSIILNEKLQAGRPSAQRPPAASGGASVARSLAALPTDYGLLCLAFLLFGFRDLFVVAYSALAALTMAMLLVALPKWYRNMARLSASGTAPDTSPPRRVRPPHRPVPPGLKS